MTLRLCAGSIICITRSATARWPKGHLYIKYIHHIMHVILYYIYYMNTRWPKGHQEPKILYHYFHLHTSYYIYIIFQYIYYTNTRWRKGHQEPKISYQYYYIYTSFHICYILVSMHQEPKCASTLPQLQQTTASPGSGVLYTRGSSRSICLPSRRDTKNDPSLPSDTALALLRAWAARPGYICSKNSSKSGETASSFRTTGG